MTHPDEKNKVIQKDFQGTEDQQLTPETGKYEGSLLPDIVAQIHCRKSAQVNRVSNKFSKLHREKFP